MRLVLSWRARAAIDDDYKIFMHAIDARGTIIAQIDQLPQAGNYPTSIWDKDEDVRDEYVLQLPDANTYSIVIGLYRPADGARLPASGDLVAPSGDSIVLKLEQ